MDIAVTTLLFIVYTLLEIKSERYLNNYVRIMIMSVIVTHFLLGEYLGLNLSSPLYNRLQHFIGAYAFALFAYSLARQILGQPTFSKPYELILVASLGISMGVLIEIGEFAKDMIFKPQVQYQPGLIDTNLDLIMNMGGSIAAALHSGLDKRLICCV